MTSQLNTSLERTTPMPMGYHVKPRMDDRQKKGKMSGFQHNIRTKHSLNRHGSVDMYMCNVVIKTGTPIR